MNTPSKYRVLFEVWKGFMIYHNPLTGQFETESGYSSYDLSSCRFAAVNGV